MAIKHTKPWFFHLNIGHEPIIGFYYNFDNKKGEIIILDEKFKNSSQFQRISDDNHDDVAVENCVNTTEHNKYPIF